MKRAIALRYNEATDDAPLVVSIGEGVLADRIERAARDYGVEVVRDIPLAEALSELRVGEPIPEALYESLAAILAEIARAAPRLLPLVAFLVVAAATLSARTAAAEEPPTFADRVDRADDSADKATRSLALVFNPLAISAGIFGAEADFALTERTAVAVEADVYGLGTDVGVASGIGIVFYPMHPVFHGLYLEPRALVARRASESLLQVDWATDVVGVGGTAGWQWTWDYGFTLRLGGGGMHYFGGSGAVIQSSLPVGGGAAVLVADASVGWTF